MSEVTDSKKVSRERIEKLAHYAIRDLEEKGKLHELSREDLKLILEYGKAYGVIRPGAAGSGRVSKLPPLRHSNDSGANAASA